MATAAQARQQLSLDLGDYFVSETTSAGAAANEIIDTLLGEYDDDKFPTDQAVVYIVGGQVGGPSGDEERGISILTSASSKLTVVRNFSVTVQESVDYEVHRLFRAGEKTRAINAAVDLCFPTLFKRGSTDVTMVADQYDYDISAAGFYRNEPRQVHKVSSSDTELSVEIFGWEVRDGTNLHLLFRPTADEKLRLFGIKKPALADITATSQLYILTARAAWYLYEQAIASAPNDQVGRFQALVQQAQRMYAERVARFMEVGLGATQRTDVFDQTILDVDWSVP